MAKRLVKSKYNVGDQVVLNREYAGYPKGTAFTVDDPYKRGEYYKINVHDGQGHPRAIPKGYFE